MTYSPYIRCPLRCAFGLLDLDRIAHDGVSTALMQPEYGGTQSLRPQLLAQIEASTPQFMCYVSELSCVNGDYKAICERIVAVRRDPDARLVILHTRSLSQANCVADALLQALQQDKELQQTAVKVPADNLLGLLVTGPGDWTPLFKTAGDQLSDTDAFPMPKNSWQSAARSIDFFQKTERETIINGIACLSGSGLTRIDLRQRIGETNVAAGEGALRPEQVLEEILAKIGAVPKFGA